jgi:hypothetical protein
MYIYKLQMAHTLLSKSAVKHMLRDRYEKHMDVEHLIFKYEVPIEILEKYAKKYGKPPIDSADHEQGDIEVRAKTVRAVARASSSSRATGGADTVLKPLNDADVMYFGGACGRVMSGTGVNQGLTRAARPRPDAVERVLSKLKAGKRFNRPRAIILFILAARLDEGCVDAAVMRRWARAVIANKLDKDIEDDIAAAVSLALGDVRGIDMGVSTVDKSPIQGPSISALTELRDALPASYVPIYRGKDTKYAATKNMLISPHEVATADDTAREIAVAVLRGAVDTDEHDRRTDDDL